MQQKQDGKYCLGSTILLHLTGPWHKKVLSTTGGQTSTDEFEVDSTSTLPNISTLLLPCSSSSLDPTRFDFYSFKSQLEVFAAGIKCWETGRRECTGDRQTRRTQSSAQSLAWSRFFMDFPSWAIRVMWRPLWLWTWATTTSWRWSPWLRRWRVTLTRAWLRRKLVRQVYLFEEQHLYQSMEKWIVFPTHCLCMTWEPNATVNKCYYHVIRCAAQPRRRQQQVSSFIVCISHIPDLSNGRCECRLQPETLT